jgi:hypothetical protein
MSTINFDQELVMLCSRLRTGEDEVRAMFARGDIATHSLRVAANKDLLADADALRAPRDGTVSTSGMMSVLRARAEAWARQQGMSGDVLGTYLRAHPRSYQEYEDARRGGRP